MIFALSIFFLGMILIASCTLLAEKKE